MPQDSYREPQPVVLIVDEGANPFELACTCEVFGARRRPEIGRELYRFRVVTPRRRVAVRDAMFIIGGAGDLSDIEGAHTIFVPNRPDTDTPTHPAVIKAVRRAHERGARLVGLCTGAYTLAEAGLLDGRPATVHWQLADDFRRRHPKVDLQPDVLFIDDTDILTSAGSAAALDLALHIVRIDHGAQIANFVSRRLVFSTFRDGGQQQFIEQPVTSGGQPALSQTLTGPGHDSARGSPSPTSPVTLTSAPRHCTGDFAPSWAPRRWPGSPASASTSRAALSSRALRLWT